MAKLHPVKKNHRSGVQINILFTIEEADMLDREMRRRLKEHPGIRLTRGGLARHLIMSALSQPRRPKTEAAA